MITDEQLARINALARKSKAPEGLAEAEKTEQAALRRAYVEAVKASLRDHLEHTTVQYPDGTTRKLSDQKGKGEGR